MAAQLHIDQPSALFDQPVQVGTFPYLPVGATALANLGGTREGNAAARRDGWSKVLAMLATAGR